MDIRVKAVKALEDYKLEITFNTNEVKILDVKPFMNTPFFKQLENEEYFKTVKVLDEYSIEWDNGHDLCPDVLYAESVPL